MLLPGLRRILLALLCLGWLWGALGMAQSVRVAVAANLQPAFMEIAKGFAASNPGLRITPSFGSSGAFVQQIAGGAPFDIFMSADMAFPQELQRRGLLEPSSLRVYAVGRLALFVPSRVGLRATGLEILKNPAFQRVIIANPQTAPYGRAALQALEKAGLLEQVRPKLAFGQNIAQVAQLTLAGADAGLVALSAVYGPELKTQGSWYMLPTQLHDPLLQGMGIIKGRSRPEVQRFFAYLSSPDAHRIYKAWGYALPQP